VSTIKPFPTPSRPQNTSQEDFEREVTARFGLVPNFFRSAPDAPLVVRELWLFAKSAYLDTPIPTLFKERLFVYLSRFCEIRYCITRHCGFLLGLGRSAGDANAPVMTIAQVVRLLQRPIPSDEHLAVAIARLEAIAQPIDWPSPETSYDEDLLSAVTVLFLQPARATRAKRALRIALGGEKFELLVGLLTFIRAAHYWTLMHPDLALEDDLKELLREHEQLAKLLSEDSEAGRCEMGARLFEELAALRELNEREELENAKRALEESGRQKDLLMKEVDHRIKNSLQIVSSLLHIHAKTAGAAAGQFHDAAARVAAIAAVHQQLHKSEEVGTIALDQYLVDLCREIAAASSSSDRTWTLAVDADPLVISTDLAVPLGLIINELANNAIKHSPPASRGGRVQIVHKTGQDRFSITVCDEGVGPPLHADTQAAGIGARMVEAFARQIDAVITKERGSSGYAVTVTVPLRTTTLSVNSSLPIDPSLTAPFWLTA
jgi:two-component sensor histidine kinase